MTKRKKMLILTGLVAAAWTPIASWVFLVGVDAHTGSKLFQHYGYVPTWQWWTYLPYRGSNRSVASWLTISAVVAAMPLLLCLFGLLKALIKGEPEPLHGEAHWATRREAEKAGLVYSRRPP